MTFQTVYGANIIGQLPSAFATYFAQLNSMADPVIGSVDVSYSEVNSLPDLDEFWYESHEQGQGSSRFALVSIPEGFGLKIQCQGSGLFRITHDRIEIQWLPGGTGAAHYFFAYAMPLWLEYVGVLVLHASAVSLKGQSIAFLGKSGVGKSSLAAGLTQVGGNLIADDGLPILSGPSGQWQCVAGPPLLKLWPASVDLLNSANTDSLDRVHDSSEKRIFPKDRVPLVDEGQRNLAAIYLLERREETGGSILVKPAGSGASVIRLIEHSLVGGPASALGLSAERFNKLTDLVQKVPVRVLSYPSGKMNFPRIKQGLLDEFCTADEYAKECV